MDRQTDRQTDRQMDRQMESCVHVYDRPLWRRYGDFHDSGNESRIETGQRCLVECGNGERIIAIQYS